VEIYCKLGKNIMSFDYRQCIEKASKYLSGEILTVDVGCNINPIVEMNYAEWIENWNDDFTFLFLEKFPQSKCIAIEPLHWQSFQNRWFEDDRVKLLKIALSDNDGTEFMFYPSNRHVLSSFYIREDFNGEVLNSQEVETKKLDTLFIESQINKINYLKIDTEGAEYKVLLGAKDSLEKKKIDFIQFEYGLTDEDIPSVELIESYLIDFGYKEILVSGREKLWTWIDYT